MEILQKKKSKIQLLQSQPLPIQCIIVLRTGERI